MAGSTKRAFKLEIGTRLRGLLEERGITQAEFARSVGFTAGYVNDIIRGRTKPSITLLRKLKDIYKVPMDWVVTGESFPAQRYGRPVVVGSPKEGTGKARYVAIPMLRNLETRVLRGRHVMVKDLHPDCCCIVPRHWVKDVKDTFCVLVKDTSMEPTIPRGSHAGVNCAVREPAVLKEKLCAVRDNNGRLSIRRLRLTETHLLFEPDNPAARAKTLCVGVNEENPVIGKVEWAWSLLK
ncbi:MAG: XRE family transcriptional regulator [Candidatus Brocadiales bacterium]